VELSAPLCDSPWHRSRCVAATLCYASCDPWCVHVACGPAVPQVAPCGVWHVACEQLPPSRWCWSHGISPVTLDTSLVVTGCGLVAWPAVTLAAPVCVMWWRTLCCLVPCGECAAARCNTVLSGLERSGMCAGRAPVGKQGTPPAMPRSLFVC
jgi:hypothetical protein